MASKNKNDLISKAVSSSIEENKAIDLLLISNYLDDINDEVIGSTSDYGMHYSYLYIGMSGQKMVDKMNANWEATDAQFLAHNNALNLRIVSSDIKQLKLENGIVYYTSDGETWNSLTSSWGKIAGDISKQEDLQNALKNKASQIDLDRLKDDVSLMGNTITIMSSNVDNLSTEVANLISEVSGTNGILIRLDNIDTTLRNKISSSNVQIIRETSGTLEYTTDGSTWRPVSTAGIVSWGDITGDIQNQPDLIRLLNNISDLANNASSKVDDLEENLGETIENYTTPISTNLQNHIEDVDNPHQVTKEQLGIYMMSLNEYDNLQEIDSNGLYIIDDTPEQNSIIFIFNTGTDESGSYNGNPIYRYYYDDVSEGQSLIVLLNTIINSSLIQGTGSFTGFIDENSRTYTLNSAYTLTNGTHTLYATWVALG